MRPTELPHDSNSEDASRQEPPVRRRWPKRIAKGLLVAALLIASHEVYRHHKVTAALEHALADLDRSDPGWRLADIEANRRVVPDEQNGAVCVVEAARLLPPKWPPPEMNVSLTDRDPQRRLDAQEYARLNQGLDAVGPALRAARKLKDRPLGRHHITYLRNTLATPLPDQTQVKRITQLLLLDSMCFSEAWNTGRAADSCLAALNAGRSLGDEPLIVSQLLRNACAILAFQALERTLAQGKLGSEELFILQQEVEAEIAHPDLLICFRGERALAHELFDALEKGEVHLSQLSDDRAGRSWAEAWLWWRVRDNLREEHPLYLSLISRRVEELRLPYEEQEAADKAFQTDFRRLANNTPLTGFLFPAVDKVAMFSRRKQAYARCLATALAVERYRQEHMVWPERLQQIVPGELPAMPIDPFDGMPLRYRRLSDGVVIYSVGQDRVDNDGAVNRSNTLAQGTDVGCRLWDLAQRRRPPSLKPAAPPAAPPG
jgi:hypothetical protein